MKKLFVTLLLFCMSASIYAADWVEIAATEGSRHYIDIGGIEDVSIDGKDYKGMWTRIVFKEPEYLYIEKQRKHIRYKYAHFFKIYSCQEKKIAIASVALYDEKENLTDKEDINNSDLTFNNVSLELASGPLFTLICNASKEEIKAMSTQKSEETQESIE